MVLEESFSFGGFVLFVCPSLKGVDIDSGGFDQATITGGSVIVLGLLGLLCTETEGPKALVCVSFV
uniref:Uncharacterized protein n=1 Tax=Rhizophora mucronata TaxID=61149 RepID=A0A2P2PJ74_RHIMU